MADITPRLRWWQYIFQYIISVLVAGALGALIGERFSSPLAIGLVSSFTGIVLALIFLRIDHYFLQAGRKKSDLN